MPAGMPKFNRKPEIPRQLHEELAQRVLAVEWRQRRRKLNEDDLELWSERFDCSQKRAQFSCAIAETTNVSDLTGKLAGKSKAARSRLSPATNRCFGRHCVKCRIHFDGRKLACIKFEPVRLWQIHGIKDTAPVVKAPCARANADLLLVEQIQMESRKY